MNSSSTSSAALTSRTLVSPPPPPSPATSRPTRTSLWHVCKCQSSSCGAAKVCQRPVKRARLSNVLMLASRRARWTTPANCLRTSRPRSSILWCANSPTSPSRSNICFYVQQYRTAPAGGCPVLLYIELFTNIAEQRARNHNALDLIRPLENLRHLHVAHITFDGVVAHIARAAQHLHGVGRDFHSGISRKALRHRGSHRCILPGVELIGRFINQQASRLDLHRHVRQ